MTKKFLFSLPWVARVTSASAMPELASSPDDSCTRSSITRLGSNMWSLHVITVPEQPGYAGAQTLANRKTEGRTSSGPPRRAEPVRGAEEVLK